MCGFYIRLILQDQGKIKIYPLKTLQWYYSDFFFFCNEILSLKC